MIEPLQPKDLRDFICRVTGLRDRDESRARLMHLVPARVRALGLASLEEYKELLASASPSAQLELRELAATLTPGETHFFRDRDQFGLLEKTILPALIEARAASRTLRIWSAGCSSGEEAYSIAIAVDSLLPGRKDWNIQILGTDINPLSLNKAEQGIYTDWSFRVMSAARKTSYFEQSQGTWRLKPNIRNAVQFRPLDLVHDSYPSVETGIQAFDLILCRNVFIYFEPDSILRVLEKMAAALIPGGYLMTAHGELYGQRLRQLQVLNFRESAVYQKTLNPGSMGELQALRQAPVSPPLPQIELVTNTPAKRPVAPALAELDERARNLANKGNYEAAEECCMQALRENPFAARIYYLLSRIAEEQKQSERSKELLKKVLYLDPDYLAAYLDLASAYDRENDPKRARKLRVCALDCLKRPGSEAKREMYESTTEADLMSSLEALVGCETT